MKKIFGVLSLIAVLTISFASEAVASDNDVGFEYVATTYSPDNVVVAVVEVPMFIEFINVADESVNYIASKEDVKIPDIVSKDSVINSTNHANIFLPFEVGLSSETINFDTNNLGTNYANIYLPFEVGLTSNGVDNEFKDLPFEVGWTETNV